MTPWRFLEIYISGSGDSLEVYIVDKDSLERYTDVLRVCMCVYACVCMHVCVCVQILCVLQEVHSPNWVAQLCFLNNVEKKGGCVSMCDNELPYSEIRKME